MLCHHSGLKNKKKMKAVSGVVWPALATRLQHPMFTSYVVSFWSALAKDPCIKFSQYSVKKCANRRTPLFRARHMHSIQTLQLLVPTFLPRELPNDAREVKR